MHLQNGFKYRLYIRKKKIKISRIFKVSLFENIRIRFGKFQGVFNNFFFIILC